MLNNSEAVLDFYKSMLEKRIAKLEIGHKNLQDDLTEIKSNLKWVIRLILILDASIIIGIFTKVFSVF